MANTTTCTDIRAYLDAHGQPGAPTAEGWYVFEWIAPFVDMLQPGRDPCSGITRHAPLRLADLTAERDAANALTTLGALLNLGPTATWREVSAAVAEMIGEADALREQLEATNIVLINGTAVLQRTKDYLTAVLAERTRRPPSR